VSSLHLFPSHVRALPAQTVASRHGRRDHEVRRFLATADLLAVSAAYIGVLGAFEAGEVEAYLLWTLPTLPAWTLLFRAYGLYGRDAKRISHCTLDDVPWLAHAVLIGCLVTWCWFRFSPAPRIPLAETAMLGFEVLVGILLLRSTARRMARRRLGPERVVLVGGGPVAALLLGKMRAHSEYNLEPVGTIGGDAGDELGLPRLGELERLDLADLALRRGVERVVIAQSELDPNALLDLVRRCKPLAIKVSVLPPLFGAMGPAVSIDDVEGVTVLGINPPVLSRSARTLKRWLDVAVSAMLLLVSAPLLALVAAAIRLESRGSILFRQERVGRGGRPFTLFKLRTMVADAEARRAELLAGSDDPNWLKIERDPRITRIGGVLRHMSIDELPQLWNVLRGDMSLVGPRPLIASEDERVGGWDRSRLDLTPGITGLWQVLGRTNIPFEEMVKLDYVYVTNWSLWTDVRLILRTLPAVMSRRGVN
jgi:exopolysaccharide biosynthesis polyprenyl glycosylphosphotransferase